MPAGSIIESPKGRRYRIGMKLGEGAFAIVYLAWDEIEEQRVAIKEFLPRPLAYRERGSQVVHAYGGSSQKAFARGIAGFIHEATVLRTFDHPNIVSVADFFEANSTAYLVMPYTNCVTLGDYLDETFGYRLAPETAVRVMVSVLDGLTHVHGKMVEGKRWSHRDVKPSNILLRADMTPLLIDFGAARVEVSDRNRAFSVMHTPGYAPPEQYGGGDRSRGPWVDVYGCAATLYMALTGFEPVDSVERLDAVRDKLPDPLVPPIERIPEISQAISDAVMQGMALDLQLRPQNAGEFRQLLLGELTSAEFQERVVQTADDPPIAASPAVPEPPPGRRNSILTVVLGVACIALAGVSLYLWDQWNMALVSQKRLRSESALAVNTLTEQVQREASARRAAEARILVLTATASDTLRSEQDKPPVQVATELRPVPATEPPKMTAGANAASPPVTTLKSTAPTRPRLPPPTRTTEIENRTAVELPASRPRQQEAQIPTSVSTPASPAPSNSQTTVEAPPTSTPAASSPQEMCPQKDPVGRFFCQLKVCGVPSNYDSAYCTKLRESQGPGRGAGGR